MSPLLFTHPSSSSCTIDHSSCECHLLLASEYADDESFQNVFKLIQTTMEENPAVERNELYRSVLAAFPTDTEHKFVIDFHQANVIDNYFFGTGVTQYWREPYGFPIPDADTTGTIGIFTFNRM